MKVEAVRLEGRELTLTLSAPFAVAKRWVYKFKPGEYEITKTTRKRSKDANAYCWILCDKIAQAVGITKEEVYRDAVKEVGRFLTCYVVNNDLDKFVKQWESQGLGYQVEVVSMMLAHAIVHAYYGSHLYDSQEMARLIDYLIQDAKALDIETMSEEDLASLLASWG